MAEVAQSSCIPHTTPSAGAPSAHKHSQFYCVKQSQLCCVKIIAILLRRQSRATPQGRELVCEYRTAGLPVKSFLLRREDLGGKWSLS